MGSTTGYSELLLILYGEDLNTMRAELAGVIAYRGLISNKNSLAARNLAALLFFFYFLSLKERLRTLLGYCATPTKLLFFAVADVRGGPVLQRPARRVGQERV